MLQKRQRETKGRLTSGPFSNLLMLKPNDRLAPIHVIELAGVLQLL